MKNLIPGYKCVRLVRSENHLLKHELQCSKNLILKISMFISQNNW